MVLTSVVERVEAQARREEEEQVKKVAAEDKTWARGLRQLERGYEGYVPSLVGLCVCRAARSLLDVSLLPPQLQQPVLWLREWRAREEQLKLRRQQVSRACRCRSCLPLWSAAGRVRIRPAMRASYFILYTLYRRCGQPRRGPPGTRELSHVRALQAIMEARKKTPEERRHEREQAS